MTASLIPRARRFATRLKALPLAAWPQAILRTGLRVGSPQRPGLPENFRVQPNDDGAIARDADHAASMGVGYKGFLEQAGDPVDSARVLELGPGRNFGVMLTLACMGARVAVADRYLAPWEPGYHGKFYLALRERLKQEDICVTLAPLDAVISAQGYPEAVLLRAHNGGEDLSAFSANAFDAVFSNAVLEHVRDHARVFSELFRVTRPGGFGSHQVDFRDHRSLDRPLELLLLSPEEYREEFDRCFGESGCQMRPSEMRRLIEAENFVIQGEDGLLPVEPAYMAEFLPRLRASRSAYRDWPEADLLDVSVRYVVRKPL